MFKTLSYWTLDEALALIRGLQPEAKKYGYHLCLGGGVLNKGESKKDLDLYFLALNGRIPTNPTGLIHWLEGLWGGYGIIGANYPAESMYPYKVMFGYSGLRIDVFVLGGEANEETGQVGEGRDIQFREQSETAEGVPTIQFQDTGSNIPFRDMPIGVSPAAPGFSTIQWDATEPVTFDLGASNAIRFTADRNESQPITQETQMQAYQRLTAENRRHTGEDLVNPPVPGTYGAIRRSDEPLFRSTQTITDGRRSRREAAHQNWSESMLEGCATCGQHRGRHSTLDGRIRCPILNTRPSEFSDTEVFVALESNY